MSHGPRASLTLRQTEVIQLLAGGWRHKEIADYLGISDNSVKKRAQAAFKKLGARTPPEAVYQFYCNGEKAKRTVPFRLGDIP